MIVTNEYGTYSVPNEISYTYTAQAIMQGNVHDLYENNPSIRIITKNTFGNDVFSSFSRSRFQSIEDIREDKLKQLGII